ncbi:argininosuccinate synthase [Saccharopolyspora sp. WRP15-2]|uniref:argininosuccinate synthase n=1 Tax=Saccharopolyspora oryzae TaxID=2997343 RepID=A0ABT4V8K8_9PSEU|nr:argininosuccinate synthase domain-containing protein [Saccharopolyspora oryzae]MDA3630297.1 argininosuccinate synthase [Saccharopolyspora oryzae]
MSERVVLAYSGDPDSSAAIRWFAERTRAEVVAITVDLGQGGEDLAAVRRRALDCGAVEAVVTDARDEFAEQYCLPALQANALPPVPALSRPMIAKHLVAAADQFGANAVAHGCAGEHGHLEADVRALAPRLGVVSPGRGHHDVGGKAHCAIERNIWGRSAETVPPQDVWGTPDAEELTITFDRGVPVAIDGETVTVLQAIRELNLRAGAHGVGTAASYQAPGAITLITAHRELEAATLEPDLARFKSTVGHRWSELVEDGLWFSPFKDALDAFVADSQQQVSGEVRIALHEGRAIVRERPWRAPDLPTWYDSSERELGQFCGQA